MKKITLIIAFAALVAALFQNTNAKADILRVNNQGFSADTTDLQAAINLAHPGDTIHVEASGMSYPAVTIAKKLVLIGPGYFLNENPGLQQNSTWATVQAITLNAGASGSVLTGLRIALAPVFSRIFINESNVRIERCFIEDGIAFQNSSPAVLNDITIRQCYDNNGIIAAFNQGPINNLMIANCYFGTVVNFSSSSASLQNNCQGMVEQCVFNAGVNSWSSALTFRNNIVKAGTFQQNSPTNSVSNVQYNLFVAAAVPAWLSSAVGNTNLSQASNVFIPVTTSTDKNLQQNDNLNCPVCYQGFPNDTTTMGVYGGADPYRLSGIPSVPAIYLLQAPATAPQGGSINVNISTRSNN